MNLAICLSLSLLLASCCFCAKLPSCFKKCNRYQSDFNQCLRGAVENAIKQLNKPIENIGLNSLEPLEVQFLTVDLRTRSVDLEEKLKNVKWFGFTNITLLNFDMNFETKTLFMDCLFPEIRWAFDYDFDGTFVSKPFKGKGPGWIHMRNVRYILIFTLSEYVKTDGKHFEVVGAKCVVEPELLQAKFENLFDGDKELGDKTNKIINDNWKMLYGEIRYGFEAAFADIFSTLFNRLLANVPATELFEAEQNRLSPTFIFYPFVYSP